MSRNVPDDLLMPRPYFWPIFVASAIVLTLVSGLIWTEMLSSPGGEIDSFYGLPFPWKENRELVCSPLYPQACQSHIYITQFDWFIFAVDVLTYTGVGYGFLLIYTKYRAGKSAEAVR